MLIVGACFLAGCAAAADNAALEYKVKAGYLFNFAKFVEWPQSSFTNASAPLVVGLVGDDPFGQMLDEALAGKNVNGRGFVIRHYDPQEDLSSCHVLFVSRSAKGRAAKILETLRERTVLTVGESDGFGQLGGMINFTLMGGQVKIETNPEAAAGVGLKVSSKLLAASRTVKTESPR